jgi:hypothetical protein
LFLSSQNKLMHAGTLKSLAGGDPALPVAAQDPVEKAFVARELRSPIAARAVTRVDWRDWSRERLRSA